MGPSYGAPRDTDPVACLRAARRSTTDVLLEGVHAVKHAVRFGARLEAAASPDPDQASRLLTELAPDVTLAVPIVAVSDGTWRALTGRELPSPLLAVARRPRTDPSTVVAAPGRVVLLEHPRHLGNLGAAVRVAAAAGAGGLLVLGEADPWHPTAVRAAAGLQFALAVARTDHLPAVERPIVALDPAGAPIAPGALPPDALVAIGTERGGLSPELAARAERTFAIPMRPGVSSLNLATALAAALYGG